MKRLVLVGILVLVFSGMSAQETRGEKQKQINELYKTRKRIQILNYLDTLNISSGAKRKLRLDLDENPFSARFQKFMERYKKEVLLNNDKTSIAQQK